MKKEQLFEAVMDSQQKDQRSSRDQPSLEGKPLAYQKWSLEGEPLVAEGLALQ